MNRHNMHIKRLTALILAAALFSGCSVSGRRNTDWKMDRRLQETFSSLVSSAENSTTDWKDQYDYIEDIGDGRGYTAGLVGFTTATGDLLEVVKRYVRLKPEDNLLEKYLPALEQAVGTDTHDRLQEAFVRDWKAAARDPEMKAAQDQQVRTQYLDPAVKQARLDGLTPLGAFIYYDALVVHGPGEDPDSFGGIRQAAAASARRPAQGGEETAWLEAFLDARSQVMEKEEAHRDLSRIAVQRQFLKDGKWDLAGPLEWSMYGDDFRLPAD